jgi:dethiobiotin synthetase
MSIFITGTGTGVGKTVVTAGLADAVRRQGYSVCVYKPIQTGSAEGQPEDPTCIQEWLGSGVKTACTYCFPMPAAPYVADSEGRIQVSRILEELEQLQKAYDVVLVEGAGGVRVPITQHLEMLDLIRLTRLPVLVVASPFLGTINHTLLTVDALRHAGLTVCGVVVSGVPTHLDVVDDPSIQSLAKVLSEFLPVPLLRLLPEFLLTRDGFASPSIQADFDALRSQLFEALSLEKQQPPLVAAPY